MEISKATKKDLPYISVKLCPICGEVPERATQHLGRPRGHGYPGCYSYQYKCECCRLVSGVEACDISKSKEEAIARAKETWNAEVERVLLLLDRIYVPRVLVEHNCE